MSRECFSCAFWEKDEESRELGECRRYAPRPKSISLHGDDWRLPKVEPVWPRTLADEWCGEFEARPDDMAEAVRRLA